MQMPSLIYAFAVCLGLALPPLAASAQTISQPLDGPGNTYAGTGGGTGQSFVATMTGFIVGIDVRSSGAYSTTLRLYNGGNGSGTPNVVGTPAYTQSGVTLTAQPSGGPFSYIPLTTPFPIVAGNAYTLMFGDPGGERIHLRYAPSNVYAGGNIVVNWGTPSHPNNGDVAFQIYEVAAAADLEVTQVPSTTIAAVGDTITYTMTFTNKGPSTAAAVTVTDDLAAAGLTLVSAQSSVGSLTTGASQVSLSVGSLASGESGTLTVVARVAAGGSQIEHTVSIQSTIVDPVADNNSSTHLATRVAAPTAVPALSQWAMILLGILMAGFALLRFRWS